MGTIFLQYIGENMNKVIAMDSIYLPAQKPQKSCQDYCLVDPDNQVMILSDGCSSSKNTDVGARILCHQSKLHLRSQFIHSIKSFWNRDVIFPCFDVIRQIGLNTDCLDATLIVAYIDQDQVKIVTYGDGSHITINKNNEINTFVSFSYDQNAPYYLSYLLNHERSQEYKRTIKNKKIETYYSENNSLSEMVDSSISDLSLYEINELSMVMITSDGIESFFNHKTGEKISSIEVVKELIKIKSKNGDFIKRRVKRMMDDFSKKDIYNSDDLSVCAFIFDENI